jgi:4-hydroxybenzoate polyprenyltransferase
MGVLGYLKVFRAEQWYKNLLVFLPLVFVKQLFSFSFFNVLVGFAALCLVSSSGYIINDILDVNKDRLHPEKKLRLIASGAVNKYAAFFIAMLLAAVSLLVSFLLDSYFGFFVLLLFCLTLFYTLLLKHIPFADIVVIGVNFIIRALSGAFIIFPGQVVRISPWLILCPFFLALFLAAGKRKADIAFIGKNAQQHKHTSSSYTPELVDSLMNITTTSLLLCYALFSFNSEYPNLMYTIPFVVYILFRHLHLVNTGSPIARKTYLLFKDLGLVAAGLLWAVAAFVIIYLL